MLKVYISTIIVVLVLFGLGYYAIDYAENPQTRGSWSSSKASPGITNSWLQ